MDLCIKINLMPDGVDWIATVTLLDGRVLEAYGPGEEGAVDAMKEHLVRLLDAGEIHPMELCLDRN